MIKILRILLSSLLLLVFLCSPADLSARIKETKGSKDKEEIQRTPRLLFDNQYNTVSNISFPLLNNGIFGLDKAKNEGGGYWPRGSQNQYIFGGGIWFGAVRSRRDTAIDKKYVELTYNPNSGNSWFVPGRIEDGDNVVENDIQKYRCYFSTDFSSASGEATNKADGPNWPIWDASSNPNDTLKKNRYFGRYILNTNDRNSGVYSKGPAIISGEDIFTTFKDTDMQYFEGGANKRANEGYPLRLQIEHTIYSWGFGDYRDFIFLRYDIINYSDDTLRSCWLAPVMDVDIARSPNTRSGASNDRVRFYEENPTLNMAFQWTNNDLGEANRGFGYLGFDFLESPAVYKFYRYDTTIVEDPNTGEKDTTIDRTEIIKPETNFVRKDSAFYDVSSQLGLVTFRNWPIEIDPQGDEERYDFMALGQREGDTGPGDKRFMMATGPFHVRPKDTVRTVVAIILANTGSGRDATATPEDLTLLIARDKFAQKVYDNNFQAPTPPDPANFVDPDNPSVVPPTIKFKPLNNGIVLAWDNKSDLSTDENERGLDFMGYKIYRARVSNLDTFNVDEISAGGQYNKGAGPFGWKQIGQWEIQSPANKSVKTAGFGDTENPSLFIDSLKIVNLVPDPNDWVDGISDFAVKVMFMPKGLNIYADPYAQVHNFNTSQNQTIEDAVMSPVIVKIDTGLVWQPWGNFLAEVSKDLKFPIKTYPDYPKHYLFDSVLMGIVYLNEANLDYNPLFYYQKTVRTTATILDQLPPKGIYSHDTVKVVNGDTLKRPYIDSIYQASTYRSETVGTSSMYFIDVLYPRKLNQILNDFNHIQAYLDTLYTYIKKGYVKKYDLPDFSGSERIKKEVITPYMARITNNRTVIDIGDDNRDGVITYDPDPTLSEKIINNVEYFYKILSYDEGDFLQPTPGKQNDASDTVNVNLSKAYAFADRPSDKPKFEITYLDSNILGGLYNFQFYSLNNQRVNQLFAGHEFELSFQPHWNLSTAPLNGFNNPEVPNDDRNIEVNLYHNIMTLKDLTTNQEVFRAYTYFETEPCEIPYRGSFTENAASYILADIPIVDTIAVPADTITFGTAYDYGTAQRGSTITTGDFTSPGYCYTYGFTQDAMNLIGFSFDYSMIQFGGRYRPDTTSAIVQGDAVTPIGIISDLENVQMTKLLDSIVYYNFQYDTLFKQYNSGYLYGGYNNGPSNLLVEFTEGGVETMPIKWGSVNDIIYEKTFNVRYLIPKVTEVITFKRPKESNPLDSVEVNYTAASITHSDYPINSTTPTYYPDIKLVDSIGALIYKYNLTAYGFVNARSKKGSLLKPNTAKPASFTDEQFKTTFCYIGTQGRYYTTAISDDGLDTLDFSHVLTSNGVPFGLDYVNKGRAWGINLWEIEPAEGYVYGPDFKAGDKVLLKTFGGALGLPVPGAKVRFKISSSSTDNEVYTSDQLNQVSVVPNPYYISHQGQKSPYDAKIYFTRLPKTCTIEIYTANGDLVQTIQHDEIKSFAPDKVAIDTWDLLSSNKQRVKSQIFVAIIRTPDGAETVKEFSVVVGSTRVIQD